MVEQTRRTPATESGQPGTNALPDGGAVPEPRARRQAHIRDTANRDRRTQAIDHIEQGVHPRGRSVIHLALEPAFTLVSPPRLHGTTNNGHLVLPEKIAFFLKE
jgi:hypothetical protein